jgi:hypothetical protein
MDINGNLYVSDSKRIEVRRWKRGEMNGTLITGGNGNGGQLNQLSCPTFIFVDGNESLYVSDMNNHRVMKWVKDVKERIVVDGNGFGGKANQLRGPRGISFDRQGDLYVANSENHRIQRYKTK